MPEHEPEKTKTGGPTVWMFYILGGYFLLAFHIQICFDLSTEFGPSALICLLIAFICLLIPSAKSLTVGKILSFEARALREEVTDFKQETREILATYNNVINTLSTSVRQSVVVNNVPSQVERIDAEESLDEAAKEKGGPNFQKMVNNRLKDYVYIDQADPTLALAKLRIDIEKQLRVMLKKRSITHDPANRDIKYLSAGRLFRYLTEKDPTFLQVRGPFEYVMKVCNAAMHGQLVDQHSSYEALQMGVEILELLKADKAV